MVKESDIEHMVKILDINEYGHLIVQKADGKMKTLISGEIKIL